MREISIEVLYTCTTTKKHFFEEGKMWKLKKMALARGALYRKLYMYHHLSLFLQENHW